MATPKTRSLAEQERLRRDVVKLHLRGCTQVRIAKMTGISQGRVSQILSESIESWRARRVGESPEQLIAMKLAQLQDVRQEAWAAWERSKGDAVCTVEEQELRAAYRDATTDGKRVDIPVGKRLAVVRAIRRVESRLPANEYLQTVVACLVEEARLEGLTPEVVLNLTQVNTSGGQKIAWDELPGGGDADCPGSCR